MSLAILPRMPGGMHTTKATATIATACTATQRALSTAQPWGSLANKSTNIIRTNTNIIANKMDTAASGSSSLLANASLHSQTVGIAVATASFGVRCFKSKSALKLRCPHCFFAKRGGKLRVICKDNPKHKQVQM
ncbi:hypothetical protein BJ741DRAFT_619509 [Chytriomyces cf. hyalinus JEL632]|nr:hypothetical protein BJ741DRAFT_619509 [Chytriomyces cf. hyalinus JEL632]